MESPHRGHIVATLVVSVGVAGEVVSGGGGVQPVGTTEGLEDAAVTCWMSGAEESSGGEYIL